MFPLTATEIGSDTPAILAEIASTLLAVWVSGKIFGSWWPDGIAASVLFQVNRSQLERTAS
ncbi:MAG TPA: hypothetical protein VIB61_04735 [Microbacteriaceae bacterium]